VPSSVPDRLSVPDLLQAALRAALKQRDTDAVAALRTALAAIGNAEALPRSATQRGRPGQYVAGSVAGLGTTEASRRALTEDEIAGILRAEIAERRAAADQYEQAGHADRAARLRREADALAAAMHADPGAAARS